MEELNAAWQAASQDIYNAQQASGEGQPEGQPGGQPGGEAPQDAPSGKGDDEVTDVDFEEVK
jgi:molecular chaperone DnaK